MAGQDKRVIEQQATSEVFADDWFLKDSVTEGTTKISSENLKAFINEDIDLSAEAISYDNTASGLEADNVQDAIDEVLETAGKVDDVKVDGESVVDENKVANIDLSALKIVRDIPNTPTAIASFEDGSNLPMPKLEIGIEPQQDLHGYDSPWVGGAGRNLFNMGSKINGNFANMTVVSDDNYITFNGTKYGQNVGIFSALTFSLGAGTYYAKAFAISGTAEVLPTISVYKAGGSYATDNILNAEKSFALDAETTLNIAFTFSIDNKVYSNYKLGVVISKTSSIDKFAPYSNICPISGWYEANVSVCGVNVWDEEWELGGYSATTGNKTSSNYSIRSKNKIAIMPNMSYYCSFTTGAMNVICFYDKSGTFIADSAIGISGKGVITTPNNAYFMAFQMSSVYGTTYNNDISINYPSTDTSYHAYNGQTYTIDLNGTRYGGKVDLVSGVMTVDRAYVDLGDLSYIYDSTNLRFQTTITGIKRYLNNVPFNAICEIYKTVSANDFDTNRPDSAIRGNQGNDVIFVRDTRYTDATAFKTAMNGVQLVYELATPLTVQLSPTLVKSLQGINNVWADSGDVIDGKYIADASSTIASLDARITALENQ